MVKNKKEKIRFGSVGLAATSIDFVLLFVISALGFPAVAANFISTGLAFCFSFFANRHFAFKATNGNAKKQLVLFFIVTFIGIWGIQPVIIWVVTSSLDSNMWPSYAILFVAKLCATSVTLVWNYFFYSRVVFKGREAPM
jgi:putative flippase GtrA